LRKNLPIFVIEKTTIKKYLDLWLSGNFSVKKMAGVYAESLRNRSK